MGYDVSLTVALLGFLIAGLAFITPAIIMHRQTQIEEDEPLANPFPLKKAESDGPVQGQSVLLTAKPGRHCPHRPPRKVTYLADRNDDERRDYRPGWAYFRSASGQRFSARVSDIINVA